MRARRCSSAPLASATRQAQWTSLGSVGRLVRDPLGNKLARRLVVVWLDAADVVRLALAQHLDQFAHLLTELEARRHRPLLRGLAGERAEELRDERLGRCGDHLVEVAE